VIQFRLILTTLKGGAATTAVNSILMTTSLSRVHYQTNFVISVIFEPPGVIPL